MQVAVFSPTTYYLPLDARDVLGCVPRQSHQMRLETVGQKDHLSAPSQKKYLHKEVPTCGPEHGLHLRIWIMQELRFETSACCVKCRVSESTWLPTSCTLQVSLMDVSPYFVKDHQEATAIAHL